MKGWPMDLTMRRQWTAALLQLHAVRERLLRLPTPTPLRHAQRPLPWRAIIRQAASLWLATRLAYAVLTLYVPLATGTELPSHTPISAVSLIHLWANWDGAIYLHIAQVGYYSPTISSFFPLYPAAIRLVATLIGPHWVVSGLIISNLSALLACIGIASLAAQIAPAGEEARVARIAVTLFLAYPLAFFLVATYSDGLFAGLAALTLFFALRRRWGWVALFSALAALARPIAPALLLPLAWEALQRYREARAVMSQRQAIRVALPGLAALLAPIACSSGRASATRSSSSKPRAHGRISRSRLSSRSLSPSSPSRILRWPHRSSSGSCSTWRQSSAVSSLRSSHRVARRSPSHSTRSACSTSSPPCQLISPISSSLVDATCSQRFHSSRSAAAGYAARSGYCPRSAGVARCFRRYSRSIICATAGSSDRRAA